MRDLNQIISLLLSALIIIPAIFSCFSKPSKVYSHIVWFLFGLVGFSYYAIVLTIGGELGHFLSPIVRSIQYTLVASWLWMWVARDIKRIRDGN